MLEQYEEGVLYSPSKPNNPFYRGKLKLTDKTNKNDVPVYTTITPRKRKREKVLSIINTKQKISFWRSPNKENKRRKLSCHQTNDIRKIRASLLPTSKQQKIITSTITLKTINKNRGKPRTCSQKSKMGNISARDYAASHNLHSSFQWLHLLAHMLGGTQFRENLICGTWSCNIFMLTFEYLVKKLLELRYIDQINLKITADLKADKYGKFTHIADKIKYEIECDNKSSELTFYPLSSKWLNRDYKRPLRELVAEKLLPNKIDKTILGELTKQAEQDAIREANQALQEDKENTPSVNLPQFQRGKV